jgi:hypothetical protein
MPYTPLDCLASVPASLADMGCMEAPAAHRYCSQCGSKLASSAKFCSECGASQEQQEEAAVSSTVPSQTVNAFTYVPKSRGTDLPWLYQLEQNPSLMLAALVVIAVLVIGGVMLKINHDNRCKPVPVQKHSIRAIPGGTEDYTYEVLEKPPGC